MLRQLQILRSTRALRACALAVLLLCIPAALTAQLSGTYTIGSGGSYGTFAAAVTALTTSGVSGAVTFNVLTGTYNEQITIPQITGAGPTNTITFQSNSGNRADVTLYFTPTSTNNYIVQLNGADYVTFQKMTLNSNTGTSYGVVFDISGDANHNRIVNNSLFGVSTTSSSGYLALVYNANTSADSTIIDGNTFTNGAWGVVLAGINSTNRSSGNQITNNTFSAQGYGFISLDSQSDASIIGNTADGPGASRAAELHYCDGALQIQKNRFSIGAGYGIYLYFCDGGTGLPTPRSNISNNMVTVGGSGAYGITLYYSTYQDIYFNSVNNTSTNVTSGAALDISGTTTSVNVVNNVFANPGGGYAVYVDALGAAGLIACDYNDLYTPGNYIGYWGTVTYAMLSDLQTASGKDANSISVYPSFTSATDLHSASPWLDGKGTTVSPAIGTDFDGDARSVPHDIGADAFTAAPSTTTPLAGSYTIGSGGTYATFTAAVNDLLLKGVSAAVTFDVITKASAYIEHFSIPPVPGASSTNTITFESQSGTASDVTVYYAAAGAGDNYVIQLNGADYVQIRNMSLASNTVPNSTYATVVLFTGGVEGARLEGNTIAGTSTGGGGQSQTLVYADNSLYTSRVITGNTFTDGSWAVTLSGINTTVLSSGTQITANTFNNGYGFVHLDNQSGARVNGNTGTAGSRGAELYYCNGALQVQKNRFSIGAGYGIYLYFCNGGTGLPTPRGNISNNMVSVGGGGAYGITLYYSTYNDVYFNSVNITSPYIGSGTGLYVTGTTTSVNVVDNVFANPGGGYAVYVDGAGAAGLTAFDYNDLYTPGNYIGYWGTVSYPMLADLQTASGMAANSISVYPSFTSATDLHSASPWLDGKGTTVSPAITTDYDGNARSVPHDIGADAFTAAPSTTTPLAGTYTIGAGGNYATFTAAVNDLLLKGVSAAVTFDVLPDIYLTHFTILPVPGASSTNTVTFESQSGAASDVTVYYAAAGAGDNYVIQINGADYIRLRNMTLAANSVPNSTYATVVLFTGGVEGARLEGNTIAGTATGGGGQSQTLVYGDNALYTSRVITGNTFTDGSWAVTLSGINTTVLSSGTQITTNTFNNGYGFVHLDNQSGARVNGNTGTAGSRGAELYYCNGALQVQKNKFSVGTGYGIYLYFCSGGTGLPTPRGNISNNMVSVGGGGGAYGITLYYSTYNDVYFNSVNITSPNVNSGMALYITGTTTSVNVINNVFANPGGGYAVYVDAAGAAGLVTCDYNDLYTPGNFIGYWGATLYPMLTDLLSASGKDANSISVYPSFTSATDLHSVSPWLDGKGTTVSPAIGTDFDGDARSVPHDIGADAFTAAPSTTTPLAGAYTIGSGGTYPTFAAAVNDLLLKGVSAAVTFNVLPGTYNTHFSITPVPGASGTNTVTFQSQSGSASDVTVYYAAAGAADNYVVLLFGADYVRLRNMTLAANSVPNSTYSTVVLFYGGVEDARIEGNTIAGTTTAGGGNSQTLVYGDNALYTSRVITGNTFTDGSWAVTLSGINTTVLSSGTQITANTFNNGYGFVHLDNQSGARINGNTGTAGSRGAELYYCDANLQVQKNKFSVGTGYGVYLYFCDGGTGSPTPRGLVANNVIQVGGGGAAYGITLYYSTYQDVYFNSANITTPNVNSGTGLYVAGTTTSVNVVNNVFANPGGGYAVYVDASGAAGLTSSDYNDLYASGTNLAYWNGNLTDLAALKSASGKDAQSLSVNPLFYSTTNLRVQNAALDSAGTALTRVTDDFDGIQRDLNKPDIGAYEFSIVVTLEPAMYSGWNMTSLPLHVENPLKSAIFPGATSNAFAFFPAPIGYASRDTIFIGRGYWIKYPSATVIPMTGAPALKDTINLNVGWNLIGTIDYPMPKALVVQNPGGIVSSNYFAFNGPSGYGASDTLSPGRGYWVKASAVGSIILDVRNTTRTAPAVPDGGNEADLSGMIAVSFTEQGGWGRGATLYVADGAQALANPDNFELPPVPPAGAFDVRFASNRFADVLPAGVSKELPVMTQGLTGAVKVTVSGDAGPGRMLSLVERTGSTVSATIPLTDGRTATINPSEGKRYSIAEMGLPAAYTLDQNYPNPFNPTTTVRYALPVDGTVSLTVFNVLGEQVAAPADRVAAAAGYHTLEIDATAWPTGAYFYSLRIQGNDGTSYTKNLKMLLVR